MSKSSSLGLNMPRPIQPLASTLQNVLRLQLYIEYMQAYIAYVGPFHQPKEVGLRVGECGSILRFMKFIRRLQFSHRDFNSQAYSRAGRSKNLRFLKKVLGFQVFLGFLGFNVRTVARGVLDTEIRSRRRSRQLQCTAMLNVTK